MCPASLPGELWVASVSARGSKHSDNTKHSDNAKARDERGSWVKNLPPVIGTAYWPE